MNTSFILTIGEIDGALDRIQNEELTRNTNDSFLMARQPRQNDSIILGASFKRGSGGQIIQDTNEDNIISSNISTAAVIRTENIDEITSLNMLIVDDPSVYRNIDNTTNKTLASSIVVALVKRNISSATTIGISLYFQIRDQWKPNTTNVRYFCSFYDTINSQWNESGCDAAVFNAKFNRYECSCNHLTSFALLWLPDIPLTSDLSPQDIASLVFQSISIVCFILIILHAILRRLRNPVMSLRAFDLLPLISGASTTILFIFYIALGLTVYTKTTSMTQTQCPLSSSVLMFFVYFFVLYMFCVKTSIGYFNYIRFVVLFPEPSCRKLFGILVAFFFISMIWVAFAIGFNSNPSYKITKLIPYKICWFSPDRIHYFFTIPVCLFLAINFFIILLVARRIINHVRNSTSPHQSYKRMKQCVIVLLSSCITQGLAWILGPLITISQRQYAEVLGWFFVVFNGLEGLWMIILYVIIQSQHMDEQKRVLAYKERTKSTKLSPEGSTKTRKGRKRRRSGKRALSEDEDISKERTFFDRRSSNRSDNRSFTQC